MLHGAGGDVWRGKSFIYNRSLKACAGEPSPETRLCWGTAGCRGLRGPPAAGEGAWDPAGLSLGLQAAWWVGCDVVDICGTWGSPGNLELPPLTVQVTSDWGQSLVGGVLSQDLVLVAGTSFMGSSGYCSPETLFSMSVGNVPLARGPGWGLQPLEVGSSGSRTSATTCSRVAGASPSPFPSVLLAPPGPATSSPPPSAPGPGCFKTQIFSRTACGLRHLIPCPHVPLWERATSWQDTGRTGVLFPEDLPYARQQGVDSEQVTVPALGGSQSRATRRNDNTRRGKCSLECFLEEVSPKRAA